MPRRVAKSAVAQDDIEVDEQEQRSSQHDSVQDADQHVDSEEETPKKRRSLAHSKRADLTKRSKSRVEKVKSQKGNNSRARPNVQDSDNEHENIPFDRDEFLAAARPISDKGTDAIGGLAKDWKELRHQVQNVGLGLVTETAVAVEEVSVNKDGQEAINQLDEVMRQLIDAEKELTVHEKSLKDLQSRTSSGETINNLEDVYEAHVQNAMNAYNGTTSRQKYIKNDDYFKFRERVWEVNHSDAMPPIRDFIAREDADSDNESEIEIGGMTQDYKCPLTLTLLNNPLTSKLCNHSFSADAIRDYLKNGDEGKPCPASGCNRILTLTNLAPNRELAKRVADAARRAKRREEENNEDEEEVID